jgi:hypothetical protein
MSTTPFPDALLVGQLPTRWELAFGYRPDHPLRWLAAYWEPAGDEAVMDDGQLSGTANWPLFLDLVDRRLAAPIAAALAAVPRGRWALGSSETQATHCLLCDLHERQVFVAPLPDARRFLHEQIISSLPHLEMPGDASATEQLARFAEAWQAEQARRAIQALLICRRCQYGFVPTEEGYDPCPQCRGESTRWVDREEVATVDGASWTVILPADEHEPLAWLPDDFEVE